MIALRYHGGSVSYLTHPFTLRQLQYLVAVADARSFRRASELCHVSQPSLSAQVAQAEAALGVRLFERDRRRVLITRAGEALLPRLRAALLAADDLAGTARQLEDPLQGVLRFGIIPTIAPYLLPAVAPALAARFPGLAPLWREDRTAALVAALEAGDLDAGLVALEAPLGDLARVPIGSDPFLLCAPAAHPLARGTAPIALAAIGTAEVLVLDEGHCLREQALAACARTGAREAGFRATSLPTLVQLVGAGAGLTLLPQLAAKVELARAKVRARRFKSPEPGRTLGWVFRAGSPLADALGKVGEALRECYAGLVPRLRV